MKLVRCDPKFTHFPVDAVCDKHKEQNTFNCPLEPLPTETQKWRYSYEDSAVLRYNCGSVIDLGPGATLNVTPSIIFPCNSSCGKYKFS